MTIISHNPLSYTVDGYFASVDMSGNLSEPGNAVNLPGFLSENYTQIEGNLVKILTFLITGGFGAVTNVLGL